MATPTQKQIYQSAVDFKDGLIARDQKTAERIIEIYARSFRRMERNIQALVKRIEEARARGEYVSPSWAFQIDRYETLQQQITSEVNKIAEGLESTIIRNQQAAVYQALGNTVTLAQMSAQNAGVTVSFSRLNTAAAESIAGFLADGSPLNTLLAKLPGQASLAVANALTESIVEGHGATKTASRIKNALGGNMTRAMTIARTETIRAYREATSRSLKQNSDIIAGWVWVASFSRRTCASCLALAGTVHPVTERMESHVRCRCTQAPLLRGQAVEFQKGEEWFATQPEIVQRSILGSNVAYDAYQNGQATLLDFVGRQNSPQWGRPYYQLSTKKAILKQSQFPGYNHPTEIIPLEDLFGVQQPKERDSFNLLSPLGGVPRK